MELFREDGHLTQQGMLAAVNHELDELARLEVAEHLSFCDTCLDDYLSILERHELMEPSEPVLEPVLRRLKNRGRRILFSKYTTVAAAACLVLAMWGVNMFTSAHGGNAQTQQMPASQPAQPAQPAGQQQEPDITTRLNGFAADFSTSLNRFFTEWRSTQTRTQPEDPKDSSQGAGRQQQTPSRHSPASQPEEDDSSSKAA